MRALLRDLRSVAQGPRELGLRIAVDAPAGQVSATDPSTSAGATRVLVVVGRLPTYIRARRATHVAPRVAPRHE